MRLMQNIVGVLNGTNIYTADIDCVKEVENLGFDSIWTSEAWS